MTNFNTGHLPDKPVRDCTLWERIIYWWNNYQPWGCSCCHQPFYIPEFGKRRMEVPGIKHYVMLFGGGKSICPDPDCQKWAIETEQHLAAWGAAYYLFTPGSCYYEWYNKIGYKYNGDGTYTPIYQDNEFLQRAWREGRVTVRPQEGFDVTEDYEGEPIPCL